MINEQLNKHNFLWIFNIINRYNCSPLKRSTFNSLKSCLRVPQIFPKLSHTHTTDKRPSFSHVSDMDRLECKASFVIREIWRFSRTSNSRATDKRSKFSRRNLGRPWRSPAQSIPERLLLGKAWRHPPQNYPV